jgi:hypothetical protein
MPPPNKTVRSLRSIRTHSGTIEGTIIPYKAYVVVTTLEMEKFRREAERAKLITRFEFIKTRLEFIESEKADILRRMGRGPDRSPIEDRTPLESQEPTLSATPTHARTGFRMKY